MIEKQITSLEKKLDQLETACRPFSGFVCPICGLFALAKPITALVCATCDIHIELTEEKPPSA